MRAAVSTRYGPPEVVHVVDDAPEPEVAPDDLLVRVHATTAVSYTHLTLPTTERV